MNSAFRQFTFRFIRKNHNFTSNPSTKIRTVELEVANEETTKSQNDDCTCNKNLKLFTVDNFPLAESSDTAIGVVRNKNNIRHGILSICSNKFSNLSSFESNANNNLILNQIRRLNVNNLLDDPKFEFETVTLSEMKRFFRKYEILFDDGYTCFRINCFLCKREQPRKKKQIIWESGKLYVNKTTGLFVCMNCKVSGSWKNLQDLVIMLKSGQTFSKSSLNFLKQIDMVPPKLLNKLNELELNSKEVSAFNDDEWDEISKLLGIEVLKKSTFESYEARYNSELCQLLLPIYNIEKQRVAYTVLAISQKTGELEEFSVPKNCNELSGWKFILESMFSISSKSRHIILVPSALDLLSVVSSVSHLCLSLPAGFTHFPQECLPQLEYFDNIVLWFGNDLKSWEIAKTVGRKLGEKRCRFVRPQEDHPAPFLSLQQKLSFNSILNSAQTMDHKAITTFSKMRDEVFSEFSQHEQVAGIKWKRFPYLNKILKGHRRGELTVFTGPTGSGKTTFMSEYSLDLCMQGINTLWGSFEIRNVRLAKTMLTQFAEKNLENHISEYDKWADLFEKLPLYFMTFHGQQSVKAVLDAMAHAAYVYDITHVVVDNLQFMLGVSESTGGHLERFWKQDLIVASFRKFATLNNCHVTLVMHPRKEESSNELSNNSIFGGAKASQEADNIMILQDGRLSSPRGKKYLQLTKNRFSGDLGMFNLEFDKESLSFSGKKKIRSAVTTSTNTKPVETEALTNVDMP